MEYRLVSVVGAVALITVGCTDDGVPDLETAPAIAQLRSTFDVNGTGADLDGCPIDDFENLLDDAFALVDDQIIRDALLGSTQTSTFETASTPSEALACELFTADGAGVGFYLLDAPDDIVAFSNEFAGAIEDGVAVEGVTVDVDESRLFRGGRLHRVCVSNDGAPEFDYCEVDWLDDNLMVGVFALGEGATSIDLNGLEERYQYVLPTIVDRLSSEDLSNP